MELFSNKFVFLKVLIVLEVMMICLYNTDKDGFKIEGTIRKIVCYELNLIVME